MMPPGPGRTERRSTSRWQHANPPSRILVTRFHAIGDVAVTFPACKGLSHLFPHATVDLLTSSDAAPLAKAVELFANVWPLRIDPRRFRRSVRLVRMARRLRREQYDVVIDLQRNWMSRLVRRLIGPGAWSEFDRFSPRPAGDRTLLAFHEAGFPGLLPVFGQAFHAELIREAGALLEAEGWHGAQPLVVLNPAGLWETRNWPMDSWIAFARAWMQTGDVRFLLLSTPRMASRAAALGNAIGNCAINLAARTPLQSAYALLSFSDIVVTEDSGLMHMAWSLGKPVVALFGSSPHYWSLPTGSNVRAFDSGDLECGACLSPVCKFGNVRCLARVRPGAVLRACQQVLRVPRKEPSQP